MLFAPPRPREQPHPESHWPRRRVAFFVAVFVVGAAVGFVVMFVAARAQ